MITEIGSRLRITNPSPDMVDWCKKHLEIPNPESLVRRYTQNPCNV